MQQYLQNKKGLVQEVFDQVFDKYDLMNDFMSLGIHRLWKKNLINLMSPSKNKKLIDVACGTGDIGKLYLNSTDVNNHVTCVDPNKGMIAKRKKKSQINLPDIVCRVCGNHDKLSQIYTVSNESFKYFFP